MTMLARVPRPLSPAERKELEASDPDLLKQLDAKRKALLDSIWPEPTVGEVQNWVEKKKTDQNAVNAKVEYHRGIRFERDMTPEKWQKKLTDGRRVRTRWAHNEIRRVAAIQLRNGYRVKVPPKSSSATDRKRATNQERWLNALLPALERSHRSRFLRQTFVKRQVADGMGIWEFYLTEAYDDIDFDQREGEATSAYNKRIEEAIKQAGLPFGIRPLDRTTIVYEEDENGFSRFGIIEKKPKKSVLESAARKMTSDERREAEAPDPGMSGVPAHAFASSGSAESRFDLSSFSASLSGIKSDYVETIRYYDPRWTAYIVEGHIVGEVEEHGLPDIPIFIAPADVTGSPFDVEAYEGVTWGPADLEVMANDLLTFEMDRLIKFGEPKLVAEADLGSPVAVNNTNPPPLNFGESGNDIPQLVPGQRIVDVTKDFRLESQRPMVGFLMGLLQQNGLNPIAQGQSPGADAAGYTVNNLMGAATAPYYPAMENEANCWAEVCDFTRLVIRDTIGERCYLSAPMADDKAGGTEWLGLDPDDIDETPAEVTIDPLNETSRIPIRTSMQADVAAGRLPLEVYWRDGYGVQDTSAWVKMLLEEASYAEMRPMLTKLAMQAVTAQFISGSPELIPPDAAQVAQDAAGQAGDLVATGGMPAPLQPPATPAGAASRRSAIPGADNGYRPDIGVGETAQVG